MGRGELIGLASMVQEEQAESPLCREELEASRSQPAACGEPMFTGYLSWLAGRDYR